MPAVGPALAALVQTKMDTYMSAVSGHSPLAQSNPSYFIAMCTAIGTGIATGSPVISFTTSDSGVTSAPPIPGAGTGVGIVVDDAFFKEQIYTNLRNNVIAQFGSTSHDAYPPGSGNSGEFVAAMAQAIAEAVKEHYQTAWTLTSSHPTIYAGSGTIGEGSFSGLVPAAVASAIQSAAPTLAGPFWPQTCQAIAQAYVDTIHTKSTGTVSIIGVCVPSPSQVCGLPGSGSGSGVAA
jgi:hypothetical protein